jgi:hypothetical protein
MKKISIVVFLILLLCVGCGSNTEQPDAVSQKMINDINAIGEVTLDDEDTISKLLNTYSTLTDKQKENVNNYAVLLEAQDSLEKLKKEKHDSEQKELDEKLNERHMKHAIQAAKTLKKNLYNPDSFNLLDVYYSDTKGTDYFLISITYSGENKLGGTASNTVFVDVENDKQVFFYEDTKGYTEFYFVMTQVISDSSDHFEKAVFLDTDFISEHLDD